MLDDFEAFDMASVKIIKSIYKYFEKVLLIICLNDQNQETLDKLNVIEQMANENQISEFRLSGLKKRGPVDQVFELLQKEFKIGSFTLDSTKSKHSRTQTLGKYSQFVTSR